MKHANFWVSILAMAASLATVCVIVMPPNVTLKGLAWVTLALAAAGLSIALVARRSPTNLASKGREIP